MRFDDVVALTTQRIKDDYRDARPHRNLNTLRDIAQLIAQDLAAADDRKLRIAALPLIARPAALAVVVVVGGFDHFLPEKIQHRLRIIGVMQGMVDRSEL